MQPFQSSQYCAFLKTEHSHSFYISHKSVLNKLEKIFQTLDLFFKRLQYEIQLYLVPSFYLLCRIKTIFITTVFSQKESITLELTNE